MRQGLILDEDAFVAHLRASPGSLQWLLRQLYRCTAAWQQRDDGDLYHAATTHPAVRLLSGLSGTGAGPALASSEIRHAMGPAGAASSQVRHLLVSFPGPGDEEALDLCPGLQLPGQALAPASDQLPTHAAAAQQLMSTCHLALQALGVLLARGEPSDTAPDQQDPDSATGYLYAGGGGSSIDGGGNDAPRLPGGLPVTDAAVEALYCLCVLLAARPAWLPAGSPAGAGSGGAVGRAPPAGPLDLGPEQRGGAWAKVGLELESRRLAAVHEAASACNAAMQRLDREGLAQVCGVCSLCIPAEPGFAWRLGGADTGVLYVERMQFRCVPFCGAACSYLLLLQLPTHSSSANQWGGVSARPPAPQAHPQRPLPLHFPSSPSCASLRLLLPCLPACCRTACRRSCASSHTRCLRPPRLPPPSRCWRASWRRCSATRA